MGEALRDAYARACIEHEAACEALKAARTRVEVARETCERLEAALQMTGLSEGVFPDVERGGAPSGCAATPQKGPARKA